MKNNIILKEKLLGQIFLNNNIISDVVLTPISKRILRDEPLNGCRNREFYEKHLGYDIQFKKEFDKKLVLRFKNSVKILSKDELSVTGGESMSNYLIKTSVSNFEILGYIGGYDFNLYFLRGLIN